MIIILLIFFLWLFMLGKKRRKSYIYYIQLHTMQFDNLFTVVNYNFHKPHYYHQIYLRIVYSIAIIYR